MSTIEKVVAGTIVTFLVLLLYTRILGKKQMSQLTYFNYITGITLGSLCANIISKFINTFLEGLLAITVWSASAGILGMIVFKSLFFKSLFDGKATIVIKSGQVQFVALKRLRLNVNDLTMLLREANVFSIDEVDYAIFEPNGSLSVLKKINKQSVTKEEMKIMTPIPKYLPTPIIADGKIITSNLKEVGLTKDWVKTQLRNTGIDSVKKVLYGEIKQDGSMLINQYERGCEL